MSEKRTKSLVLQVGETTHTHVLKSEKSFSYVEKDGSINFRLEYEALLAHEEHGPMRLKEGNYFRYGQVEYDPMAQDVRYVFD